MKQPYKKHFNFGIGMVAVSVFILIYLVLTQGAHAEIYNPHPTPTTNSITGSMIINGTITNADINSVANISLSKLAGTPNTEYVPFQDIYGLATTSNMFYNNNNGALTIWALAVRGSLMLYNDITYHWPSTQGAAGTSLTNDGSGNLSWVNNKPNALASTFTAWETINKGDAVSLGITKDYNIYSLGVGTTTNSFIINGGGPMSIGQVFTTRNDSVNISGASTVLVNNGGILIALTIILSVYNTTNGIPSGSPLISQSYNLSIPTGTSNTYKLNFTNPLNINPNTQYAFVFATTGSTGYIYVYYGGTPSVGTFTSTTSVLPTTPITGEVNMAIYGNIGLPNVVYESNSSNASIYLYNKYIGIAQNSGLAGSSINVAFNGISTASTTLATSTSYYLTDTSGLISPTAGTNSKKVGYALSSGKLLLTPATF